MLSLTTTGTVDFDQEVDSSLLPAHLAGCLRNVDADVVEVRGNRVTFKGGMFRFVTNWNVLVPFGFGALAINSETREIRYCLSYRQLIIFSTTVAVVAAALVLTFSGLRGLSGGMLALPLMWFFAVFINLTIGISRFESLLSSAIATAPRMKP